MNIWIKSVAVGILFATAAFFVYNSLAGKYAKPVYTLHYAIKLSPRAADDDKSLFRVPEIIQKRVNELGFKITVNKPGDHQLDMVIGNVRDTLLVRKMVENNNTLEVREVYSLKQLAPAFQSIMIPANAPQVEQAQSKERFREASILTKLISFDPTMSGGAIGVVSKNDTAIVDSILRHSEVLNQFPPNLRFYYTEADRTHKIKSKAGVFEIYALRGGVASITADNIRSAEASMRLEDIPEVTIEFTQVGARKWAELTTENVQHHLAILVDGIVVSAPLVTEPITGGKASISGGFTEEECRLLAAQLNSGPIPPGFNVVLQKTTPETGGPTGKKMMVIMIVFVLAGGLAFLVFKLLGNK